MKDYGLSWRNISQDNIRRYKNMTQEMKDKQTEKAIYHRKNNRRKIWEKNTNKK